MKMPTNDLVRSAKEGDRQSLQKLIELHIHIVERFAFQIGVPRNDVEDVTQEVFIRVFRFLHQYSGKTFTTWLYKITLNVARDYFKKRKREQAKTQTILEHTLAFEDNVEQNVFEKEEDAELHMLIQQLDVKYKVPLVLFYFHDKKIEEIARILSLPVSTVKTRLLRARLQLTKQLQMIRGETNATR